MENILVIELLNRVILTVLNEVENCRGIEPEMTKQNNLLSNIHCMP